MNTTTINLCFTAMALSTAVSIAAIILTYRGKVKNIPLALDGQQLTDKERTEVFKRFNEKPTVRLFITVVICFITSLAISYLLLIKNEPDFIEDYIAVSFFVCEILGWSILFSLVIVDKKLKNRYKILYGGEEAHLKNAVYNRMLTFVVLISFITAAIFSTLIFTLMCLS